MSTRQERRDWQEFRERHGSTFREFKKKWQGMFGRNPSDQEAKDYHDMRRKLRTPLGRAITFKTSELSKPRKVTVTPVDPERRATVTKRYEWDMAHRLPQHEGKCRRLHGHRYVAEIDFTGQVHSNHAGSSSGMVVDFGDIKRMLDGTIGVWDHCTMLHDDDPLFLDVDLGDNPLDTSARGTEETAIAMMHHYGIFRVPYTPTAENIAIEIRKMLLGLNLPVTRVRVYETPSGWAEVLA